MSLKSKFISVQGTYFNHVLAFIINMVLVYVVYALCRLVYLMENWAVLSEGFSQLNFVDVIYGCLKFDTSAIIYTNILYALLMLFPLHFRETKLWNNIAKWVFFIVNSLCVVMNLGDSVYFQFTGRRTTFSVFNEFSNEGNLGGIFGVEVLRHWYIVLLGLLLIAMLWFLYCHPKGKTTFKNRKSWVKYYAINIVCFVLFIPMAIGGMRGGMTKAVRPITISNANQYVNRPAETALILNTPFSMIRTIGKNVFNDPKYLSDEEMNGLFSPVHNAKNEATENDSIRRKNVVVLIVESFGKEYIGALNKNLDGGKYKGYTPFVDSLIEKSLTFDKSFANGRKSIDGMPSILSSIPMFVEPFFLTPSSMNDVSGIAGELGKQGYYSAFFHGAENGSMGFEAFAKATGFKDYFGRTEYNEDKRYGGDKDFDGTWAIWDEPFLQFYATKMTDFKEPFVTAVFTASSHHPFVIPEKYKDIYKEDSQNVIHKCIRYTDNALRNFFQTAEKQPWFKNTIFVLTSDHTNLSDHSEYQTDLGVYSAPIIIYDPSGDIQPGRSNDIAQQIDIMPTLLNHLGYPNSYVAFGIDLLNVKSEDSWAVNYNNGIYQFVKNDYLIQFDGQKLKAVYNICKDPLLKHNLISEKQNDKEIQLYENELKAIIQSYMQRMVSDSLVIKD